MNYPPDYTSYLKFNMIISLHNYTYKAITICLSNNKSFFKSLFPTITKILFSLTSISFDLVQTQQRPVLRFSQLEGN